MTPHLLEQQMNEFTGEIPLFRTGYNYDRDQVSKETGLACDPDENMTQQHHAEEADINTIVRRFGLTGELPAAKEPPEYGDFSNVTDYHTALNAVMQAEESFQTLPAAVRATFANDPGALLDFLNDENNREKAAQMGLVPTKKTDVQSAPATTPQPATTPTTEGQK